MKYIYGGAIYFKIRDIKDEKYLFFIKSQKKYIYYD